MYEWDENKNKRNIRIHKVSFEEAKEALEDPDRLEFYDEAHSMEEDRYICIGGSFRLLLMVVYTDRDSNIRIISAREALGNERRRYYEQYRRNHG